MKTLKKCVRDTIQFPLEWLVIVPALVVMTALMAVCYPIRLLELWTRESV